MNGGAGAYVVEGQARPAGAGTLPVAARVELLADGFVLRVDGRPPVHAAYRDLTTVAVSGGSILIALGEGAGSERWLLERFGDRLGPLTRELRDRRLRQRLADCFVVVPAEEPIELVEYALAGDGGSGGAVAESASGVAQIAVHGWGFVLAPLDERTPALAVRRADIGSVASPSPGALQVDLVPRRGVDVAAIELRGLGEASTRWARSLDGLRAAAADDAARIAGTLLADASFGVRRLASSLLVDGQPVSPPELGDGWSAVEAAVLVDPAFAASYATLVARAGADAPRWLAVAPSEPGGGTARSWFLVGLPGNLLALELVSEGAHATYCFRVVARAGYRGESPAQLGTAYDEAARAISDALVDARFLREPIALSDAQLARPDRIGYRLALAALPTLAAARRRFVGRLVHRDQASWSAALDDLIAWHGASRDDGAQWPGRAAQEAMIADASADDASAEDASADNALVLGIRPVPSGSTQG